MGLSGLLYSTCSAHAHGDYNSSGCISTDLWEQYIQVVG